MVTQKHKVVVIDDEKLARDSIRVLLSGHPDWVLAGEARDGREGLRLVREHAPDLIFLDVEMPRLNGLDVLAQLPQPPHVIFTTAHHQFAVKAFEENAVDYLLKPYTDQRFFQALARAKAKLEDRFTREKLESITQVLQGQAGLMARPGRRLPIQVGDQTVLVDIADILWVNASGNYVEIFTTGGRYLHYDSLRNMEKQLEGLDFLRIHRSHIVRRDQVKLLKRHQNGEYIVRLKNDVELKLSRSYKDQVEHLLRS